MCFLISWQKINRNQKIPCKIQLKELYYIANQKSFSNLRQQLSTIFILKMCFLKNSGIVFSFKCNSCNAIYYDKTKCHFYVRATKPISDLTNKHLKNVTQSPISDQLLTCDCNIIFNNFTILSKDSNYFNLLIKEMLLIACNKTILKEIVKSYSLELLE